jgi:hypothetical protein
MNTIEEPDDFTLDTDLDEVTTLFNSETVNIISTRFFYDTLMIKITTFFKDNKPTCQHLHIPDENDFQLTFYHHAGKNFFYDFENYIEA